MDLFAVGKLLLPLLSLWGIIVGVVLIIDGVLKLRKKRLLGVVFVLVGVFLAGTRSSAYWLGSANSDFPSLDF
jgi:hypothetical protein